MAKIESAMLGGAFDPVHKSHLEIARAAVSELNLKKLILVPTVVPPHKSVSAESFYHRAQMLKIAFRGFPVEVVIDDYENTTGGVNYSSEVVPVMCQKYGALYFIIGGDSLLQLETWHHPRDIAKAASIVVFEREGYAGVAKKVAELNRRWDSDIRIMKFKGEDISSTDIRAKLNMRIAPNCVQPQVVDYISKHGLYNNYDFIVSRLNEFLTPHRLTHTQNVVLRALDLNARQNLRLPYDMVFTAAILHDIAKIYDRSQSCVGVSENSFEKMMQAVPTDARGTAVQHQFLGAEVAAGVFGVTDEDILNAIRYHTTGRAAMSPLEKLIYSADMVSAERDFAGVDILRHALYNNFEEGFRLCLSTSLLHLNDKDNAFIYPLTAEAADYYKEAL